jgi:hypothetical protein
VKWTRSRPPPLPQHHSRLHVPVNILHPQPRDLSPPHARVNQQLQYSRIAPSIEVLSFTHLQERLQLLISQHRRRLVWYRRRFHPLHWGTLELPFLHCPLEELLQRLEPVERGSRSQRLTAQLMRTREQIQDECLHMLPLDMRQVRGHPLLEEKRHQLIDSFNIGLDCLWRLILRQQRPLKTAHQPTD